MKIILTESDLKTVIFKYFDKQVEKGKHPNTYDTSKIFQINNETVLNYLVEYYGGQDKAIQLTKKILKKLPQQIKIKDSQFDGELYFNIDDVDEEYDEYEESLPISVECYGDLVNGQIWNNETDEYDYVDITLYDFYEQEDMTGGWEIRDILTQDINNQLYDMVTVYTGIYVDAKHFSIIDK